MRRYKSVKIRTKCAFCDMLYNAQTYRITQFQLLYLNKKMDKTCTFKKQYCYIITLINDDANNDNERLPDCRIAGLPDCRITGLPDCRITGLPDCRITGLPDYRITGLPDYRIKKKKTKSKYRTEY